MRNTHVSPRTTEQSRALSHPSKWNDQKIDSQAKREGRETRGVLREAEVQKSIHACDHWNGIQNHGSETCFHLGNTPAQEVHFTGEETFSAEE